MNKFPFIDFDGWVFLTIIIFGVLFFGDPDLSDALRNRIFPDDHSLSPTKETTIIDGDMSFYKKGVLDHENEIAFVKNGQVYHISEIEEVSLFKVGDTARWKFDTSHIIIVESMYWSDEYSDIRYLNIGDTTKHYSEKFLLPY